MMKFTFVLSALVLSSFAHAATVSCEVKAFLADKEAARLVQSDSKVMLVADKKVSKGFCSSGQTLENYQVQLCVGDAQIEGGTFAALTVRSSEKSRKETATSQLLGKKRGGNELIQVNGHIQILNNVVERLTSAKIEVQDSFIDDSRTLDKAIAGGFERNVLKDQEAVFFMMNNCKLENN